jgi:hypothetical protein
MNSLSKQLIILFLVSSVAAFSQSRTNLEVFYTLIDSSINLMPPDIPEESNVSIYPSENYLLYNYAYTKLSERYSSLKLGRDKFYLSYVIENISLNYSDIFRKKFLGDYFVERNFLLEGNFIIPSEEIKQNFNLSFRDTIRYDDVVHAENRMHPFTRGELPAEPFFQGIFEPVIAIGTAATAVVLFFILRSK